MGAHNRVVDLQARDSGLEVDEADLLLFATEPSS
jgi:hypothetical protein